MENNHPAAAVLNGTASPDRWGELSATRLTAFKETAHQVTNTSNAELKYLAVSTRISPEICEYPTTGKFAVFAEAPAGKDGKLGFFRFVGRAEQSADYWEGE